MAQTTVFSNLNVNFTRGSAQQAPMRRCNEPTDVTSLELGICSLTTHNNNRFTALSQAVQNAAARLVSGARRRDSVSPILRSLHWLPVRRRVIFKSAVIARKCVNGVASTYLRELCVPMEDVRSRPRLRSASTRCILLPRVQTSTERATAKLGIGPHSSLFTYSFVRSFI